jgi:hypothetical protein
MAAQIGQDDAFQILIFEIQGAPTERRNAIAQIFPDGVRVVESAVGDELIERRIFVGWAFFVGRNFQGILPDPYGSRTSGLRGDNGW